MQGKYGVKYLRYWLDESTGRIFCLAEAPDKEAAIRVHRSSADAFLRSSPRAFDLVFLDPPYDVGETELASTLSLLLPRVSPGAEIVIERAARSPEPTLPPGLIATRSKRYGDTALWWATTPG